MATQPRPFSKLLQWHGQTMAILSLPLWLNCHSVDAIPHPQTPITVEVHLDSGPEDPAAEQVFEQALRDELAKFTMVSPTREPDKAFGLVAVYLQPLTRRGAVGVQVAEAVTPILYAFQGGVGGGSAGLLGLGIIVASIAVVVPVAATVGEVRSVAGNIRLGYKPREIQIRFRYWTPGMGQYFQDRTTAFEVVEAMRPLTVEEIRQPGRLRQEEGRALALVIADHLKRAGWKARKA